MTPNDDYPRLPLGCWPTPLLRARRLEESLGCGPVLVKRDDLSGFALAGNKVRPLEYLIGHAVAAGHDTVVVGGAATSNFCQGAAVACRVAGLDCHVVLPGHAPAPAAANLAIASAAGARLVFSGARREDLDERIARHAAELTSSGRSALPVPRGGADPRGCLGFVRGAAELACQLAGLDLDQARIVLAVGSGGSMAGLLVGARRQGARWAVTGVSVSRPLAVVTGSLHAIAEGCARLLGMAKPDPAAATLVPGPGSRPGGADAPAEAAAAALLALRTEGLVLDAHYTAQAFPVALELARQPGPPVVFWHTGGLPGAVTDYLAGAAGAAEPVGDAAEVIR